MSSLSRSHAHWRSARGYMARSDRWTKRATDVTASRRTRSIPDEQLRARRPAAGPGGGVCSARAHSAATSCGCGTRAVAGSCWSARFGAVGRRGDEQPAQLPQLGGGQVGEGVEPAVGDVRPQRRPHGGQLLGGGGGDEHAATVADQRGHGVGDGVRACGPGGSAAARRASPRPRWRRPRRGLRGAGVSASVAASASARWRTPGGTAVAAIMRRICSRAFAVASSDARGGEAVDEYGEIGASPSAALSSGPCCTCSPPMPSHLLGDGHPSYRADRQNVARRSGYSATPGRRMVTHGAGRPLRRVRTRSRSARTLNRTGRAERYLGAVQWSFALFGTVQSDGPATAVATGRNRSEPSSAW